MKRYWGLSKGTIMESAAYRGHYLFTFVGNVFYIILVYFLWKSIYANTTQQINGMTFKETFMYLTLAASIYSLMQTWADWDMSRSMLSGNVVLQFLKPTNYQAYKLFENFGVMVSNFVVLFIPSFILIVFVFNANINVGLNMAIFIISILLAYLINFGFDFIVGLLSFYTESIWGISMTKEVIVLLFSGAVVPLPFFPEAMRKILELLPFQAIYNIPLQILTNKSYTVVDFLTQILIQLFWAAILIIGGSLFLKKASKIITVNGG
ncbi:MAG: ABC-2 family transporter protein [Bacillota bacterium]|nr:ABC-2 family transporter protein [Bacillota bacterium]